jgi:hypothetical protein
MKEALHLMTDEERAAREAPYRADMAQVEETGQPPKEMPFDVFLVIVAMIGAAICAGIVVWALGSL